MPTLLAPSDNVTSDPYDSIDRRVRHMSTPQNVPKANVIPTQHEGSRKLVRKHRDSIRPRDVVVPPMDPRTAKEVRGRELRAGPKDLRNSRGEMARREEETKTPRRLTKQK